jgi:hypothetical protein
MPGLFLLLSQMNAQLKQAKCHANLQTHAQASKRLSPGGQ